MWDGWAGPEAGQAALTILWVEAGTLPASTTAPTSHYPLVHTTPPTPPLPPPPHHHPPPHLPTTTAPPTVPTFPYLTTTPTYTPPFCVGS